MMESACSTSARPEIKWANLPGLLPAEADRRPRRNDSRAQQGASRQATGAAASNLDLYQVNCTFYDALGARDDEYLIARALQFFAPGVPQVYYAGLLAGSNDLELLRRTGVGRDINRHYYTPAELNEQLGRPVVRALFELIRFRNTHPAFAGHFHLPPCEDHSIEMEWRHEADWARLSVKLRTMTASIAHSAAGAHHEFAIATSGALEVRR